MALTLTARLADPASDADMTFCARAANLAGSLWDEDSARSYASDANHLVGLILASGTYNGRTIPAPVRVAMLHFGRTGAGIIAHHLAIDPARIPDDIDAQGARLKVADWLADNMLARLQALGVVRLGTDRIVKFEGGVLRKIHQYLQTLPRELTDDDGQSIQYRFRVADVRTFIASAARQAQYGGA